MESLESRRDRKNDIHDAAVSEPTAARSDRASGALFLFAVWTLFALISIGQLYVYGEYVPEPVDMEPWSWEHNINWAFLQAYTWAPLSVLVFRTAGRLRIDAGHRVSTLIFHIAFAFLISIIQISLTLGVEYVTPFRHENLTFMQGLYGVLAKGFHVNILIYAVIAGLSYAREYYRMYQSRELRGARLEAELANARVEVLRNQLNPHFLFNTLNTVSSLVHEDPRGADRVIARLSDMLRSSLQNENRQEISLREELDLLVPYLDIERTRFRDRLGIELDIDPQTLDAFVPHLILQPLVENAVRHGSISSPGAHRIRVSSRRENGSVILGVEDSGPGLPPGQLREGIGLGNTRQRLLHLYGARQSLLFDRSDLGGLHVRVSVPFREFTPPNDTAARNA